MARSYWSTVLGKRLSRRRAIAATGGTAAAAAFLAACGGSDSGSNGSDENGAKGSGLVVQPQDETKTMTRGGIYKSTLVTPPTLDPHASGQHVTHVWMNYSQLFKIKPGYLQNTDGDVEGDLVESWEMSPDKLTITAKLVQGTKFTPKAPINGREVDVQDVLFSWNRFKSVSPRRAELANELDPNAPIVSLTSPDARTLVIKLNKPVATILSSLTGGSPGTFYIVPKEAESSAVNLRGTMVGSGPFYLEEWVPSVKTVFRKNPSFKNDKRDVPYIDGVDFIDLNEASALLAQFKAGAIFDTYNNFLPDDILPTKRDVPALEIMASSEYAPTNIRAFFGHEQASPFKDERVRQAFALNWDRDLFFDAMLNVSRFRNEGLPVATGYDNALRGPSYAGWWLDPTSKEFGPNSKFFKNDPAEAKKLLVAAGFPSAVPYDVFFGTLSTHTPAYSRWVETLTGFQRDSGLFKPTMKELDFGTEWQTFRFNKGKFSGQGFIFDTGENDPANDLYSHYHSSGSRSFGADPQFDSMSDKLLQEFDVKKRIAIAHEIQKYEGGKMYQPRPGGATTFRITWPALRNKSGDQNGTIWRGDNQGRYLSTIWLDQTKPPFKS
ncbi:MAG TPA: ABC transporter substrate-binding protein [Dehalococcoidia bacterium]|nr:ABC transporter substrate-binding protein [Dehalococcoidia bacterium]